MIKSFELSTKENKKIKKKNKLYIYIKRIFDIFLSGIGLILSFPFWVLIAIFIVMEDGGPIFIKQKRIGIGGKIFKILKFRSMDRNAHLESPVNHKGEILNQRVTRVGKFLRATAMDELPQLISIFLGNMSFVGPRPIHPEELKINGSRYENLEEIPDFHKRCSVKPGLTGLAQIYRRKHDYFERKLKYDLLYLKKQCFTLDLKLILISFFVSFLGKWD
ncbi:MAG: sugar transferase [candidate division WOR-3 bacterium]